MAKRAGIARPAASGGYVQQWVASDLARAASFQHNCLLLTFLAGTTSVLPVTARASRLNTGVSHIAEYTGKARCIKKLTFVWANGVWYSES